MVVYHWKSLGTYIVIIPLKETDDRKLVPVNVKANFKDHHQRQSKLVCVCVCENTCTVWHLFKVWGGRQTHTRSHTNRRMYFEDTLKVDMCVYLLNVLWGGHAHTRTFLSFSISLWGNFSNERLICRAKLFSSATANCPCRILCYSITSCKNIEKISGGVGGGGCLTEVCVCVCGLFSPSQNNPERIPVLLISAAASNPDFIRQFCPFCRGCSPVKRRSSSFHQDVSWSPALSYSPDVTVTHLWLQQKALQHSP